jgi:ubiquinone biosynthesis protein UbiJ
MLQSVREWILPALQQRLVLLVNHVVSRESAAALRLRPHAGRVVHVEPHGAPPWLPALPPLTLVVTPAGLFERSNEPLQGDPIDLRLRIDLARPERVLAALATGERPAVSIDGDAALAADINWLADNLRWDIEADLATVFGPVVAYQVGRIGRALAAALRGWVAGGGAAAR